MYIVSLITFNILVDFSVSTNNVLRSSKRKFCDVHMVCVGNKQVNW